MGNSKPLHRALLQAVATVAASEAGAAGVEAAITEHIVAIAGSAGADVGAGPPALALAQPLMTLGQAGTIAPLVSRGAACVALAALGDAVGQACAWVDSMTAPPAASLEQLQDSAGTLYWLLARHGQDLVASGEPIGLLGAPLDPVDAIVRSCAGCMDLLRCQAAARETFVSAASLLWAAVALHGPADADHAALVASAMFPGAAPAVDDARAGPVERRLRAAGRGVAVEASRWPQLVWLNALRAVYQGLPASVTYAEIPAAAGGTTSLGGAGALRAALDAISSAKDAHVKYFAVCLLAALIQSAAAAAGGEAPAPAAARIGPADRAEIIRALWTCWEEPLTQTVTRAQLAFERLLDLLQAEDGTGAGGDGARGVIDAVTRDILSLGWQKKGKYGPLGLLCGRVGARALLEMEPLVLRKTVAAMREDVVCCAVSNFLREFLPRLRAECADDREWEDLWVGEFVAGLSSDSERLRINISEFALPVVLNESARSLHSLLAALRADARVPAATARGGGRIGATVSVLKAGRRLALLNSLEEAIGEYGVDPGLLTSALQHRSEALSVSAMELVCAHPKASAAPGPMEISLVTAYVPLSLRCPSTSMRNKWLSLMRKFLSRLHGAAHQLVKAISKAEASGFGHRTPGPRAELAGIADCAQRIVGACLAAFTPTASFPTRLMAAETLSYALSLWPCRPTGPVVAAADFSAPGSAPGFSAFPPGMSWAAVVRVLVSGVADNYTRLRETCTRALLSLPTPLPGLETEGDLAPLCAWLERTLVSPRVRESDAGARMLGLMLHAFVGEMGWSLSVHPAVAVAPPGGVDGLAGAVAALPVGGAAGRQLVALRSAADRLEAELAAAREDLAGSCRRTLAHGTMMAAGAVVASADWGAIGRDTAACDAYGACLGRVIALCGDVSEICVGVLSQFRLNTDADDITELEDGVDGGDSGGEDEGDGDGGHGGLGPEAQVLYTGTWLTLTKMHGLYAQVARSVPLARGGGGVLPPHLVGEMGRRMVECLKRVKHRGAVEHTMEHLTQLTEAVYASGAGELTGLPGEWAADMVSWLDRPGQCRDDITRRSAGIPYCLLGLTAAEANACRGPKKVLEWTLERLLEIAGDDSRRTYDLAWPRAHAFNTLRFMFQAQSLAVHASGHQARTVATAVDALSAQHWEVRNAAGLCFVAVSSRMVGYRNVPKGPSARRAVTGDEFFSRHPSLHPFLLGKLREALAGLRAAEEGAAGGGDHGALVAGGGIHPCLYPVLILLSRLRPSFHSRDLSAAGADRSPAAFIEPVASCASASHMAVRVLAAKSLAPLVSLAEALPLTESLLARLPSRAGEAPAGGWDGVHGTLLMLEQLIDGAAGAGGDAAARELCAAAVRGAAGRSFLGSPDTAPGPVCQAYVQLLAEAARAVGAAGGAAGAVQAHARDLAQAVTGAVLRRPGRTAPDGFSPGLSEFRRVAARLHFRTDMRRRDAGGAPERVTREEMEALVGNGDAEVRAGGLKGLTDAVRAALAGGAALAAEAEAGAGGGEAGGRGADGRGEGSRALSLFEGADDAVSLLMSAAVRDPDHKARRRALQLASLLLDAGAAAPGAAVRPALQSLAAGEPNPRVVQHAARCLAEVLRAEAEAEAEAAVPAADVAAAVDWLLDLVARSLDPAEVDDVRMGAASALRAVGLLRQAVAGGGAEWLRERSALCWTLALKLLEDEDPGVRAHAAETVAVALGWGDRRYGTPEAMLREGVAHAAGRMIAGGLGHHVAAWLVGCDAGRVAAGGVGAGDVPVFTRAAPGRFSSKIFDREPDNQHQEVTVVHQVAAAALREAGPGTGPWTGAVAGAAAAALSEVVGGMGALRGDPFATQRPEVFGDLMRLLLTLEAVGAEREPEAVRALSEARGFVLGQGACSPPALTAQAEATARALGVSL